MTTLEHPEESPRSHRELKAYLDAQTEAIKKQMDLICEKMIEWPESDAKPKEEITVSDAMMFLATNRLIDQWREDFNNTRALTPLTAEQLSYHPRGYRQAA